MVLSNTWTKYTKETFKVRTYLGTVHIQSSLLSNSTCSLCKSLCVASALTRHQDSHTLRTRSRPPRTPNMHNLGIVNSGYRAHTFGTPIGLSFSRWLCPCNGPTDWMITIHPDILICVRWNLPESSFETCLADSDGWNRKSKSTVFVDVPGTRTGNDTLASRLRFPFVLISKLGLADVSGQILPDMVAPHVRYRLGKKKQWNRYFYLQYRPVNPAQACGPFLMVAHHFWMQSQMMGYHYARPTSWVGMKWVDPDYLSRVIFKFILPTMHRGCMFFLPHPKVPNHWPRADSLWFCHAKLNPASGNPELRCC